MIRGFLNANQEPIIRLRVRGPRGTEALIEFLIDTGFTASLTLPAPTIAALSAGQGVLADGSVTRIDTYYAEVHWDGKWQVVLVSSMGGDPLLGMRMLAGYELRVEVKSGGAVEMRKLP